MTQTILTNAHIVTPFWDGNGSVVIDDGKIIDVARDKYYPEGENLGGMWLAPGCIDIHSDYLEKELHPRPSAKFSLPLAFHYLDQRAIACGLTTVFSAISFSEDDTQRRKFNDALERAKNLNELRRNALARHFVHARLNPNSEVTLQYLDDMLQIENLTMVVYNDSIPGQRQFKFEDLVVKRATSLGISQDDARALLLEKIATLSKINVRPQIKETFAGKLILGSHDDTTTAHVEEAKEFAATLCEMPTTIEAARRAKELGMKVCMGAPNFVRGGSHCGNLSCADAMDEGLVDMICSDYHFPSLLGSVIRMMQQGISPSRAFDYVSLNPAILLQQEAQLGSIECGKNADLVAFEAAEDFAKVHQVWVQGKRVYYSYLENRKSA